MLNELQNQEFQCQESKKTTTISMVSGFHFHSGKQFLRRGTKQPCSYDFTMLYPLSATETPLGAGTEPV